MVLHAENSWLIIDAAMQILNNLSANHLNMVASAGVCVVTLP